MMLPAKREIRSPQGAAPSSPAGGFMSLGTSFALPPSAAMFSLQLDLESLFYTLLFGSLLTVVAVMIPVQIASKLRRLNRHRTRATCRICGYRFLRPFPRGIVVCPHCGVKNK